MKSILTLTALLFLSGCGLFYQPGSVPTPPNKEWRTDTESYNESGSNPIEVLYGKKIDIGFRIRNQGESRGLLIYPIPLPMSNNPQLSQDHFSITLGFRSNIGLINIDLSKVYLSFEKAKKVEPSHYYLIKSVSSLRCIAYGPVRKKGQIGETILQKVISGNSIEAVEGNCFKLTFNIPPPDPETSFSMTLEGVYTSEELQTIPPIKFKKGNVFKGI